MKDLNTFRYCIAIKKSRKIINVVMGWFMLIVILSFHRDIARSFK